jgi:hypothetical protein
VKKLKKLTDEVEEKIAKRKRTAKDSTDPSKVEEAKKRDKNFARNGRAARS